MLVVYPVATKHNTSFVFVLGLFQLGVFDHAQVEESTNMCLETNSVKFVLGFLLDVLVLPNYSFIPCALSIVGLAKFVPFGIDGGHSFGSGFPELTRHRLCDQVVPCNEWI